ncbi:MAG: hypothetical protein MOGMAGMI_01681 [Candidatus Omnitrophica bacterium]|nr:hypothetical protein [Candidatus Omnitrophota bacterium]
MRDARQITGWTLLATLCASPVWAGAADSFTPAYEVSVPAERFRQDASRSTELTLPERPEIERPEETVSAADPIQEGPEFYVREIRLEGLSALPQSVILPQIAMYEHRRLLFSDLKELADKLTALYRSSGYVTTKVYIPPQKIEDGLVILQALEGKVGKVIVEGNQFFGDHIYTRDARTPEGSVINFPELEMRLYEMNQRPDRKARAYLQPGQESGTTDIVLKTEDRRPWHVKYGFHNRGTKLTHRSRHEIIAEHNNLFGRGDSVGGTVTLAEDNAFRGTALSYQRPFSRWDGSLLVSGGVADSQLQGHLRGSDIDGESWFLSPGVQWNLWRRAGRKLDLYAGLDAKSSKTLVAGFKSAYDQTRAFRVGPRWTMLDPRGKTIVNADVHWGFPNFFGSIDSGNVATSTRSVAGGDFTYYTIQMARVHRMPWDAFLIGRLGGQWSHSSLVLAEQYRIGGAYSVRGYPESDALGDHGYNFSLEYNFPSFFVPKDWQVPFARKKTWRETLRMAAFIDGGQTLYKETINNEDDEFLLGVGVGLRFNIDDNLSLIWDVAIPVGDDSSDDEDALQTHIAFRAGW